MRRTRLFCICLVALAFPLGWLSAQEIWVGDVVPGTTLVLVRVSPSQLEAAAWWPGSGGQGAVGVSKAVLPALGAGPKLAELVAASYMRPSLLVAVGSAGPRDLLPALQSALGNKKLETPPDEMTGSGRSIGRREPWQDGVVERKLVSDRPGVSLSLRLPAWGDPVRPSCDVALTLVYNALKPQFPNLELEIAQEYGKLKLPAESVAEAELELDRLKLALEKTWGSLELEREEVKRTAEVLKLRRARELSRVEEAAEKLLMVALEGGEQAVRGFIYGYRAVGVQDVRDAIHHVLVTQQGRATVMVPDVSLPATFEGSPLTTTLDDGRVVSVVEKRGLGLSAVCLVPVLVPGISSEEVMTFLLAAASKARSSTELPVSVELVKEIPALVFFAPEDQLGNACEAASSAAAATFQVPHLERDDPAAASLSLMAKALGYPPASGFESWLLSGPNLAMGVVAPDREQGLEMVRKFAAPPKAEAPVVENAGTTSQRRRIISGCTASCISVFLEGGVGDSIKLAALVLLERVEQWEREGATVSLYPVRLPWRWGWVLRLCSASDISSLEARLKRSWAELLKTPAEEELDRAVVRLLSLEEAAGAVGSLACRAALAAAWGEAWLPSELRQAALMAVSPQDLAGVFSSWSSWDSLLVTSAGYLEAAED